MEKIFFLLCCSYPQHVSVVREVLLLYQRKPVFTNTSLDLSEVSVDPGLVLEVVDG